MTFLAFSLPLFLAGPAQKTAEWNGLKFTPVVELRARFERRTDRDQSSAASDDRSTLDWRARLGFDFTNGTNLSGKFRYQYTDALRWSPSLNDSDMNSDVYLAYADLKTENGTWSLGRQTLNFGDKVLLEESNTGQRSKSFDILRFKTKQLDAFAGRVGYLSSASDQAILAGAQLKWNFGETLAYFKSDRWLTNANFWTLDHRYTWKERQLSLVGEGALQRGKVGPQELDSWMLRGKATFAATPKTNVYLEATAASGGGDANTNRGFDASYGTGHALLGLMDIQGYRNLNAIELGVTHKPSPNAEYLASVGHYGLRDKADGWYGTGGTLNKRPGGSFIDPTGNSGTDVGTEFNVMGKWTLRKDQWLMLEVGLFRPGGFVRSFTGASTRNQLWGLVTYNVKF